MAEDSVTGLRMSAFSATGEAKGLGAAEAAASPGRLQSVTVEEEEEAVVVVEDAKTGIIVLVSDELVVIEEDNDDAATTVVVFPVLLVLGCDWKLSLIHI